jgi:signal-transduction protein with cAMP-binding, CBS, and nucleotidyltransferase domain
MPIYVKDIMSKPVLGIDYNKNVKIAGDMMARTRRDTLIVTKNGKPIGIVTDSDLIKKVIAKNKKPTAVKVFQVMSKPLVTVKPDETILEATRKIKRSNIKRLPVTSDGKLIGLISTTDIARTTPEMLDMLEYKLKSKEFPTEIKEKFTSGVCDSCDTYSVDLKNVNDQWLCESCRDELERD